MINIYTVDHLNFGVRDLDQSIKFYKDVFGFEVKEKGFSSSFGNPYAIVGISNKLFLAMYENEEFIEDSRVNHFGINVVDFDAALEVIKLKGIKVNKYNTANGVIKYPNSRSIYIEDPDGNEIELSSHFGGGL